VISQQQANPPTLSDYSLLTPNNGLPALTPKRSPRINRDLNRRVILLCTFSTMLFMCLQMHQRHRMASSKFLDDDAFSQSCWSTIRLSPCPESASTPRVVVFGIVCDIQFCSSNRVAVTCGHPDHLQKCVLLIAKFMQCFMWRPSLHTAPPRVRFF
jgi:hypothetical protein